MLDPGVDDCDNTSTSRKDFSAVTNLGYQLFPVESTAAGLAAGSTDEFVSVGPPVLEVDANETLVVLKDIAYWSACTPPVPLSYLTSSDPNQPVNSVTLTMPSGTTAFVFEVLPYPVNTPYNVTTTFNDSKGGSTTSRQEVENNQSAEGNAKLFGAYASGSLTIASIDIVTTLAGAPGPSFYLANMQISNTSRCIL